MEVADGTSLTGNAVIGGCFACLAKQRTFLAEKVNRTVDELSLWAASRTRILSNVFVVLKCAVVGGVTALAVLQSRPVTGETAIDAWLAGVGTETHIVPILAG